MQNEKQQTAMMILRDKLQYGCDNLNKKFDGETLIAIKSTFEYLVNTINTEMLAIEKQQHLDTFVAGDERGTKDIPFNAEQYFTQTFNQ